MKSLLLFALCTGVFFVVPPSFAAEATLRVTARIISKVDWEKSLRDADRQTFSQSVPEETALMIERPEDSLIKEGENTRFGRDSAFSRESGGLIHVQ